MEGSGMSMDRGLALGLGLGLGLGMGLGLGFLLFLFLNVLRGILVEADGQLVQNFFNGDLLAASEVGMLEG
jgi:hypothetical protein